MAQKRHFWPDPAPLENIGVPYHGIPPVLIRWGFRRGTVAVKQLYNKSILMMSWERFISLRSMVIRRIINSDFRKSEKKYRLYCIFLVFAVTSDWKISRIEKVVLSFFENNKTFCSIMSGDGGDFIFFLGVVRDTLKNEDKMYRSFRKTLLIRVSQRS